MQIDQMPMARVFFSKLDRARFISHLDAMRTMTRAFKRSGLPVWYTQGFNPHIYMTFPLPLALGYEGLRECVDIRLTEDIPFELVTPKLNAALPPGFSALETAVPIKDPKEITFADYAVRMIYDSAAAKSAEQRLRDFLALPRFEVLKRTKKGEKLIDIKPLSQVTELASGENSLNLTLRMAAGLTLNINPTLLLEAFYSWAKIAPRHIRIARLAVLDSNGDVFK